RTRKAPTLIRSRSPECSNAERAFTWQTAASTATANRYDPITPVPISSADGVTAAVRPAITFLSRTCFSGKCEWARTSRISARASPQNSRVQLLLAPHLLQGEQVQPARRHHKARHQQPRLLRSKVQVLLLRHRPPRLYLQVRVQLRLRLQQLPRRQRHRQDHLRQPQRYPLVSKQVLLHRLQQPRQTQQLEERRLRRPVHRCQARRGQFKPLASRRCIPRHGTTYIFIRRAASTLIRTCRPTVSSTKSAASMSNVRPTL